MNRLSRVFRPAWSARVATTAVLLLAGFAAVPRGAAQGLGLPVFDVPNLAVEIAHNEAQADLTDDAIAKMVQYYLALRRLDDFNWRDVNADLRTLRALAGVGETFGYGSDDLAAVFAESFPGAAGYAEAWTQAKREVIARELQAAENQLRILQQHAEQFGEARRVLDRYRDEVEWIWGKQEAYDILLSLEVYEMEEYKLLRQLMMSDLTLTAVSGADLASERAQAWRTLRTALGIE